MNLGKIQISSEKSESESIMREREFKNRRVSKTANFLPVQGIRQRVVYWSGRVVAM